MAARFPGVGCLIAVNSGHTRLCRGSQHLVVLGVVLDEQELRGRLHHFAFFEEIDAAIELRQIGVLMTTGPGEVAGEHVLVGSSGRDA